jgi:hypothetical protein
VHRTYQLCSPFVRCLLASTFVEKITDSDAHLSEVCRVVRTASGIGDALCDAVTARCTETNQFRYGPTLESVVAITSTQRIRQQEVGNNNLQKNVISHNSERDNPTGDGGGKLHGGDQFLGVSLQVGGQLLQGKGEQGLLKQWVMFISNSVCFFLTVLPCAFSKPTCRSLRSRSQVESLCCQVARQVDDFLQSCAGVDQQTLQCEGRDS